MNDKLVKQILEEPYNQISNGVKTQWTICSCIKAPWIIKKRRIYDIIGIFTELVLRGALFCIYVIFAFLSYYKWYDSIFEEYKWIYGRKSLEYKILKYPQNYLWWPFIFLFSLFSCAFSKMNINCKHSNKILLSKKRVETQSSVVAEM